MKNKDDVKEEITEQNRAESKIETRIHGRVKNKKENATFIKTLKSSSENYSTALIDLGVQQAVIFCSPQKITSPKIVKSD